MPIGLGINYHLSINTMDIGVNFLKKDQFDLIETIRKADIKQSDRWLDYWQSYSHYYTWQFWFCLAMFVVPLIILILFIDRRRIFHLGFYGYSVHVFFAITDALGALKGIWIYPYKLFPVIPSSVTLDSSFVPVAYILLYQYILNKRKNYYLWMLLLCLVFAFIFKPLLVGIGFFHFGGKENFLLLFGGYVTVALIAKWITDIFIFLGKTSRWSLYHKE
jgi:uncharacterized membrane protein